MALRRWAARTAHQACEKPNKATLHTAFTGLAAISAREISAVAPRWLCGQAGKAAPTV